MKLFKLYIIGIIKFHKEHFDIVLKNLGLFFSAEVRLRPKDHHWPEGTTSPVSENKKTNPLKFFVR